jgi:GNAT superfamily N-acetyltransferase
LTAAVLTRSSKKNPGLRPIDPRRDMRAVAELIETSFSGRLDEDGRRMLRWMRLLGRLGWIGWLLSWYVLPPASRPLGFVWEAEGRIVGNASLLTVQGHRGRWVLVNVAVHPSHRGQGIGRALVEASIDLVRQRKGKQIILQVDQGNLAAHELYTSMGFSPLSTRTTWVRQKNSSVVAPPAASSVRKRKPGEWQEQYLLARRVHPEGLVWPFPPSAMFFQSRSLSQAVGLGSGRNWVLPDDEGRLLASLTIRWRSDRGIWRMILIVDPEMQGKVEGPMLAQGISELPTFGRGCTLDYPSGVAETTMLELGFQPQRTLTWMVLDLEKAKATVS